MVCGNAWTTRQPRSSGALRAAREQAIGDDRMGRARRDAPGSDCVSSVACRMPRVERDILPASRPRNWSAPRRARSGRYRRHLLMHGVATDGLVDRAAAAARHAPGPTARYRCGRSRGRETGDRVSSATTLRRSSGDQQYARRALVESRQCTMPRREMDRVPAATPATRCSNALTNVPCQASCVGCTTNPGGLLIASSDCPPRQRHRARCAAVLRAPNPRRRPARIVMQSPRRSDRKPRLDRTERSPISNVAVPDQALHPASAPGGHRGRSGAIEARACQATPL